MSPAVEAKSPNHWIAKEVPRLGVKVFKFSPIVISESDIHLGFKPWLEAQVWGSFYSSSRISWLSK